VLKSVAKKKDIEDFAEEEPLLRPVTKKRLAKTNLGYVL
jgi:hypothetical protein